MESRDLTFYRSEDTIARIVETLDPNQNPTNDRRFTASQQPTVNSIPLVFGHTLVEPVPIYTIDGPSTTYNVPDEARTKIVFYAISPSAKPFNNTDYVGNVYIDGTLVTGLVSVSPTTNKPLGGTVDWHQGASSSTGGAVGGALNAGVSGNFGGNRFQFGSNLYVGYIRAESDFTQHAFYKMFSGQIPGILQGFNMIKDYPDNSNLDMLVVFYKFNRLYFSNENPRLQITYRRLPRFTRGGRRAANIGNCLLEIMSNDRWGMGLTGAYDDKDFVYNDFLDAGPEIAGVFDLTNQPLFNIMKEMTEERTERRLHEQAGKLRFSQTVTTGVAITDDNIIGNLEIQYPDNAVAPTKLIGTYTSYRDGSTEIEIGSDDTNVISIDLKTANNLADAKTLLTQIWNNLNDTVTIRFTADRSFNQFSILDVITLSTEVFSGTITIQEISQNFDYTFNVTAHASAGTTAPTPNLRGATPVIQIGGNFYRPPEQEPTPDPVDPPDDDQVILPPFPVPGDPDLLTISGLNYLYDRNAGADNTDWYVGGTFDGTTADPAYDANGVKTRFISVNGGAAFQIDYSLIKRDKSKPTPTAIECTYDIGIGNEQNNNLIGFAYNEYRFDFPGFLNNEINNVRFNNGRGWQIWTGKDWPSVYTRRPMFPGGQDPYFDQGNVFDYQFQTGDMEYSTGDLRKIWSLSTDGGYRPNKLSFPWITANMKNSGVIRLNFTAIYGPVLSPTRVEYIGTTTLYGDERSVLARDVAEARTTAGIFSRVFNDNTQSPPSRSA